MSSVNHSLITTIAGQVYYKLPLLSLSLGLINAFDMPARQAFVIEMVEKKEDLPNAIALNSSLVNVARFIGPAVAGLRMQIIISYKNLHLRINVEHFHLYELSQ